MSYSPWEPITDKRILKLFGKLIEECGELVSATSRCIIQGIDERHPVTRKLNREWLCEELADVEVCIHIIKAELQIHARVDSKYADRWCDKYKLLNGWLNHVDDTSNTNESESTKGSEGKQA